MIQNMYKSLDTKHVQNTLDTDCYAECPVWEIICGSIAINERQKLQNRAVRIVISSRYDAAAKPITQI